MCRWAAWSGAPIPLEDVVTRPGHSLLSQSRQATECKAGTNADGFGVAWYDRLPTPGLYKSVAPAWSDPNLNHLCRQIRSSVFLAHVRASTGTATSYNNCHPFVVGNWSFMHNGQIGGFGKMRKAVDMLVTDDLYEYRRGATDSEALFLIALGFGLDDDPIGSMSRAVALLTEMATQTGDTPYLRLTACWSDGRRLFAARAASDKFAPSLYIRSNETGTLIVSEPLDDATADWDPVGDNECVIVEDGRIDRKTFSQVRLAA